MAVLIVVAFHAGFPLPGGFVGVDVFFVISGYVITAMLQREWTATGSIGLAKFYLRRFKRLTPALALMVTFTMIVSVFVLSPFGGQQIAAMTGAGAMLLVANAVIAATTGGYFDALAEANPLLNTWSLSVEEQFYLLFPAVLLIGFALGRRFRRPGSPALMVAVVGGLSLGLALLGSSSESPLSGHYFLGFYSPVTRAWEFAAGALIALAGTRLKVRNQGLATLMGITGSMMLAASCIFISGATPFPGPWTLVPVLGTCLLVVAGSHSANPISRVLSAKPPVFIGDVSYSIYLWHWPFIVFAAALWPGNAAAILVAAALSFGPALGSYYWVEQPFRTIVPKSRPRLAGLVVVTIAVPILCAASLAGGARVAWFIDWPASTQDGQMAHVAMSRGCTDRTFDPSNCTWEPANPMGTVLLAGDSQAYALADAVVAANDELGLSTIVSARSGCPLATTDTTGSKPLDCAEWQKQVVDYALATHPAVVVIANRSAGYTQPQTGWRTVIDASGVPATPENAVAVYGAGLDDVVSTLRQAGIGVVLVQNPPESGRPAQSPSMLSRWFGRSGPGSFQPDSFLAGRSPVAAAEVDIAARNPGTVVLDPVLVLCPGEVCPTTIADSDVYLDEWHLTRVGALQLEDAFREAIAEASGVGDVRGSGQGNP